jgi:hypothetical protein
MTSIKTAAQPVTRKEHRLQALVAPLTSGSKAPQSLLGRAEARYPHASSRWNEQSPDF